MDEDTVAALGHCPGAEGTSCRGAAESWLMYCLCFSAKCGEAGAAALLPLLKSWTRASLAGCLTDLTRGRCAVSSSLRMCSA